MTRRTHFLKTEPELWDATARGHRTAEFRRNDRDYHPGDHLVMQRGTDGHGPTLEVEVTHVVPGPAFGIPAEFAMLSHWPPLEADSPVQPIDVDEHGTIRTGHLRASLLGLIAPDGTNDG